MGGGRSGPSGQRRGPRGTWLLRPQIGDRALPPSPREAAGRAPAAVRGHWGLSGELEPGWAAGAAR